MNIPLRHRFIILAIQEMKGAKQRRPTSEELNKYFIECNGIWNGYDESVHWCGIFCTYLLRKAGAKVKWIISRSRRAGITNLTGDENPDGEIHTQYIEGNQGIIPGDICVRGDGQHHFIVILPPDKSGTFEYCVEGNFGGLGDPQLHQGRWHKDTVESVNYYYRIL